MWDVRACRSCLNSNGKLEKMSELYKRIYAVIAGLEISNGDGYPIYLCIECSMQIKKILAFRRKCRRAFFVLKEIMIVRKQVTLSDVMTVDRKKTNLDTSYTISKCTTIDIKPDNYEEIERLEEERKLEEMNQEEIDNEETLNLNDDGIDTSDVDLEDVFKDLIESDDAEEKELTELEVVNDEDNKKKPSNSKSRVKGTGRLRRAARALAHCQIRLLSDEEQALTFKQRQKTEPFNSALYKCGMCLTIYTAMSSLVSHVDVHNKNLHHRHKCVICKLHFPTEHALHTHRANFHMYEFRCGGDSCEVAYTLQDLVACYDKHGGPPLPEEFKERLSSKWSLDSFFILKALPHELMYQTLSKDSGGRQNVCYQCKIGFSTPLSLLKHRNLHVDASKQRCLRCNCDICGLAAKSKTALDTHMEKWHLYSYTCTLCGDVLMNRLQAKHHCTQQHKHQVFKNRYACKFCNKSFAHYNTWHCHRTQKHSHEVYAHHCNVCGYSFQSTYQLYRHQLVDHDYISINDPRIGDPKYKCLPCDTQFLDQTAYHTHIIRKEHEEAKDIELACVRHKLVFKTKEEKMAHDEVCYKYEGHFPRLCRYCDEKLYSSVHSKQHYKTHHADKERETSPAAQELCDLCGKTAVNKMGLTAHMRAHRDVANDLECNHCKRSACTPKQYVMHMLRTHTHKPYLCALCPARYRTRCLCKEHILKLHAPEKPFQCEFCARWFSHPDFVRTHARRAHDADVNLKLTKHQRRKIIVVVKSTMYNLDGEDNSGTLGKILLYPYMKLDASNMDIDMIKSAELELSDFTNTNIEVIPVEEYDKYLILDKTHATLGMKRKLPTEDPVVRKKIKTDDRDFVIKPRIKVEVEELSGDGQQKNVEDEEWSEEGQQKDVKRFATKALRVKCERGKYTCEWCGGAARGAHGHVAHMLSHHTRRPYCCALCPAKFKYRFECRDHILKSHAPVRPFACAHCVLRFAHGDALSAHSRAAHGLAQRPTPRNNLRSVKSKLFVYPHMKLDVSWISHDILEKVELLISDYLEENLTVVDNYRYYVTSGSESPVHTKENNVIENEESFIKTNQPSTVGRSMVSLDTDEEEIGEENVYKTKSEDESHEALDTHLEIDDVADERVEKVEEITSEEAVVEEKVVQDIVSVDGENYEIIEKNGEQYVTIDNILYKIETVNS